MAIADWVLLAGSLLSILIGWNSGTIRILAGLGSLILGWQAARAFAYYLASWFSQLVGGASSATSEGGVWNSIYLFLDGSSILDKIFYVIAFIIIFVLVVFIIRRIASALSRILKSTILGLLDRAVGAFFGIFIFAIILNIICTMILPFLGDSGVFLDLKVFLNSSQYILPWLLAMTGYFINSTSSLIDSLGILNFDSLNARQNLPVINPMPDMEYMVGPDMLDI